jgi:ribosome-associated protein
MLASHVIISHSLKIPITELQFRTSRSGGPGGQNVNKLETRVELLFNLENSPSIPRNLKQRLLTNLSSRLDSSGVLRIIAQDSRSQWKNKQLAIDKFISLLKSASIVPKKRIVTKSTTASKENRLRRKKIRSEKKRFRKSTFEE